MSGIITTGITWIGGKIMNKIYEKHVIKEDTYEIQKEILRKIERLEREMKENKFSNEKEKIEMELSKSKQIQLNMAINEVNKIQKRDNSTYTESNLNIDFNSGAIDEIDFIKFIDKI